MGDLKSVLFTVLGWLVAVVVAVIATLSRKVSKQKTEIKGLKEDLKQTENTLERQKSVVIGYGDAVSMGNQIQQESAEAYKALDNEKKEAQASEKPIQKSIDLGNDLVDRFNSSSR